MDHLLIMMIVVVVFSSIETCRKRLQNLASRFINTIESQWLLRSTRVIV
jgi:hypothetical protein